MLMVGLFIAGIAWLDPSLYLEPCSEEILVPIVIVGKRRASGVLDLKPDY
jgi:hypothetical protein